MGLFRSRRSVRIFRGDPVEKDKLERIIQAGRFAPTGGHRQSLHYVVLHTTEKTNAFRASKNTIRPTNMLPLANTIQIGVWWM